MQEVVGFVVRCVCQMKRKTALFAGEVSRGAMVSSIPTCWNQHTNQRCAPMRPAFQRGVSDNRRTKGIDIPYRQQWLVGEGLVVKTARQ